MTLLGVSAVTAAGQNQTSAEQLIYHFIDFRQAPKAFCLAFISASMQISELRTVHEVRGSQPVMPAVEVCPALEV